MTIKAYGAQASDQPLHSMDITRRAPGAHDMQIDVAYCGVCHSDLHQVRSEWAGTLYPCVPGHEIVGRDRGARAPVPAPRERGLELVQPAYRRGEVLFDAAALPLLGVMRYR